MNDLKDNLVKKTSQNTAELLLIITTAVWGSTFLIIKLLVSVGGDISPFALLTIRFAISALAAYIVFRPKVWPDKEILIGGLIIGVAAFGGYAFQTIGLIHTTPSRSGFITSLFVIFIPFVSRIWEKEKIPLMVYLSLIPAVIGLWAISGASFSFDDINPGDKITFLSAVSYAFQIVAIQIYTKKFDWKWLTILQFLIIAVLSSFGLFFEETHFPASFIEYSGILYLALIATVGALGVQMYAQRFTTSARASLVYIAEPIFATVFAFIILHESLTTIELAGGMLIIISMIIGRMKFGKSRIEIR